MSKSLLRTVTSKAAAAAARGHDSAPCDPVRHPPAQRAGQNADVLADDVFLTPPEAADYLNCSKSFLDKARVNGTGPAFIRLGRRKVLYSKRLLTRYALQRQYRSTSEYGD
jgi:hypothetical protein